MLRKGDTRICGRCNATFAAEFYRPPEQKFPSSTPVSAEVTHCPLCGAKNIRKVGDDA